MSTSNRVAVTPTATQSPPQSTPAPGATQASVMPPPSASPTAAEMCRRTLARLISTLAGRDMLSGGSDAPSKYAAWQALCIDIADRRWVEVAADLELLALALDVRLSQVDWHALTEALIDRGATAVLLETAQPKIVSGS